MTLNRRLESMAAIGLGGMVYTLLGLWMAQGIAGLLIAQRMLESEDDMFSVIASVSIALLVSFTLIAAALGFAGWQFRTTLKVGVFWLLASAVEWFLSAAIGPAGLLAFAAFWIVLGLVGGLLTSPAPDRKAPRAAKPVEAAPATSKKGKARRGHE